MREAVIVSYARTGLAKSGRGGFNMTPTVTIGAHAVKHAVAKAGIDGADVEDVFMGNVAHGGEDHPDPRRHRRGRRERRDHQRRC